MSLKTRMSFLVFPVIGLAIMLGFSIWRLASSKEDYQKSLANSLILEVEEFKQTNKRLPEENEIFFIDESGPVYYLKESDTSYIVHYGTSLGESAVYSSSQNKWIKE